VATLVGCLHMKVMHMKPKATYTVTYTSDKSHTMEDDFYLVRVEAHSPQDAHLIIKNIEEYFDGVVVEFEEEEVKPRRRRR
jgi:hypothetical protein